MLDVASLPSGTNPASELRALQPCLGGKDPRHKKHSSLESVPRLGKFGTESEGKL